MSPLQRRQATTILLALLLLGVLAFAASGFQRFLMMWPEALLYLLLTALAMSLGIWLAEGEFSIAHVVGMMVFLTLSNRLDVGLLTWSIALGALIGSSTLGLRQYRRGRSRKVRRSIAYAVVATARATVSFYVAAQVYLSVGGTLPLVTGDDRVLFPLLLYSATYLAIYGGIFILEMYLQAIDIQRVLRESWLTLLFMLIVPVAFSIVGALIRVEFPLELFGFVLVALVLVLVIPFGYSRGEYLLRQQLDEIQLLAELTQELQKTTHLPTLFQLIEERILSLVDADHLVLMALNPSSGQPTYPIVIHYHEPQIAQTVSAADRWLINHTIQQEGVLLVERDVSQYLQSHGQASHPLLVESWMGLRMRSGGRINGVLAVYTDRGRYLGSDDVRLLRIVSSNIATAIDNAELYENQRERLERLNTLNTISVLLSSTLSPDSVLDSITTSASMLAEANGVMVYLVSPETGAIELSRHAGLSDMMTQAVSQPLLMRVVERPRKSSDTSPLEDNPPLIIRDIHTDSRTLPIRDVLTAEGVVSMIELPLINGEQRIGAVGLYYTTMQQFKAEFVEFLRTFANESVQAVRNADLYAKTDKALEQRLVQLSILASVGRNANASMQIHEITDMVLAYAIDYTQAKRGVICRLVEDPPHWEVSAKFNYIHSKIDADTIFSDDKMRVALGEQQPHYIDGVGDTIHGYRLAGDSQSQLIVPLLSKQEMMGFVLLESAVVEAFVPEDIEFIVQLMNQAAIAIDNRMLFQTVLVSRDRMQVVLDAITEGIVLLDRRGHIVMANPAVRLIGFESSQLMGRDLGSFTELVQERNPVYQMGFESVNQFDTFLQHLRQGEAWETIETLHYTVQGEHGELYIERHIIPILSHDESHLAGAMMVFYNQTEKRELDRTRDDFTRMIVHDLRSPLGSVLASFRLIQQVVPDDIENYYMVKDATDMSNQVVAKLLRRVDSLLDIAKLDSGELSLERESVILSDIVSNVFDELRPLAEERNITLHSTVSEALPRLYVDRDKTERLLQNLVDNALKYTPAKTNVTVQATIEGYDFMRVMVVDEGPGVPPEYKERLFDRFVQIRGRRGARRGVGLGLTFCRLVVDAHGGKIWVEDNPTGGSRFCFSLPLISQEGEKQP